VNIKDIAECILSKTIELQDVKDDLTENELEELIKSLEEVKEELSKQWGMINALKDKGLPVQPTASTTSSNTSVNTSSSVSSKPSIAEQINWGGQYRPVGKGEKINYFDNGQWDIEAVDKTDEEKIDTGIKAARTQAMMARVTGDKKYTNQMKNTMRTVKDIQGKSRMTTEGEKKQLQEAKDKADLKELRSGKDRRQNNPKIIPIKERRVGERREAEQQKIAKSGYQGYTETDNIKRKSKNIGDTEVKAMPRIKRYGGSGPSAATKEAKEMKAKSAKNPIKYSHKHPETGEMITKEFPSNKALKSYIKSLKKK